MPVWTPWSECPLPLMSAAVAADLTRMSVYAPESLREAVPVPAGLRARFDSTARADLRRFRRGVLALGVTLMAFAFLPFVLAAVHAARTHQLFLGAAGFYPYDELQYLAWVRDAQHGLIRNLYGSAGSALFVHPMWSPSGWLQALTGISDAAIMGFWRAVGVIVLVAGCARLAARHIGLGAPRRRTLAVAAALLAGLSPLTVVLALAAGHGSILLSAGAELIPAAAVWDWAPLAIALGLMPFVIERIERLVDGSASRRDTSAAAGLAVLIAWLHPWQGEIVMLVGVGLAVWHWVEVRGRVPLRALARRLLPLAAVLTATGLPLIYYLLLSKVDRGWATASATDVWLERIPLEVLLGLVAPAVALVLVLWRRFGGRDGDRVLIAWALATALTVAVTSSGQYRALDGITIPVAVLVIRRWPSRAATKRRLAVWALVAAALAPAAIPAVEGINGLSDPATRAYEWVGRDDAAAARAAGAVAAGRPVLTTPELGAALPALADAAAWIGHPVWTPHFSQRVIQSYLFTGGGMTGAEIRRLVLSVGARAVVSSCRLPAPGLARELAPLRFTAERFGCATLYRAR